jgi:hypothetical protein
MVGAVIRRVVEFVVEGLSITTVDDAPDELPTVCAQTGVAMVSTTRAIDRRMTDDPIQKPHDDLRVAVFTFD